MADLAYRSTKPKWGNRFIRDSKQSGSRQLVKDYLSSWFADLSCQTSDNSCGNLRHFDQIKLKNRLKWWCPSLARFLKRQNKVKQFFLNCWSTVSCHFLWRHMNMYRDSILTLTKEKCFCSKYKCKSYIKFT